VALKVEALTGNADLRIWIIELMITQKDEALVNLPIHL